MAQIAVEKRSPMSAWWLWLLLALLVIGLIWYFAARNGGEEERNRAASTVTDSNAITDMSILFNINDPATYAGRVVSSNPVRVLSVTGDQTFWVGDSVGRQVLVVLDQQPTPNQPATEGRYDVNSGQMVRVYGHVERFPGFAEAQRRWGAGENTRSELEQQKVYVAADRLDITSRP